MQMFRYIALGDSTAVGVGANNDGGYPERLYRKLKAIGVPAGIINLGLSGATTSDLLGPRLLKTVDSKPHLITLGIGTNDGWRMTEAKVFAERIGRIADALEKTGAAVVVSNIADLAYAPSAAAAKAWLGIDAAMITERIRELNVHLDELEHRPNFTVVDLFTLSQTELPSHPEYFCGDGFHPSPRGYDHWANAAWPAVESVARAWLSREGKADRSA